MTDEYLDKLFSLAVIGLTKGKCSLCGGIASETHHIIHRWKRSTRWHILNGFSCCRKCHDLMHEYQKIQEDYFVEKFGREAYNELLDLSNQIYRPGNEEEIAKQLRRYIRQTNGGIE